MISHRHRAIYFHIGKTAGTSVEFLLGRAHSDINKPDFEQMLGWDPDRFFYLQHATARVHREQVGDDVFNRYYKFSIVRNPFVRLLSVYFYMQEDHDRDFGDFAGFIAALPDLLERPRIQLGAHYLPQTAYTHLDGEAICDHVAHFERLPDSLDPVLDQLGITAPLRNDNPYRSSDWSAQPVESYYSERSLDTVLELYDGDFEQFGYSRDVRHSAPLASSPGSSVRS